MWPNSQETADLVTFTEEILSGKLHFLCSAYQEYQLINANKLPVIRLKDANPFRKS